MHNPGWERVDSNHRSPPYEGGEIGLFSTPQWWTFNLSPYDTSNFIILRPVSICYASGLMVEDTGFEPVTFCFT